MPRLVLDDQLDVAKILPGLRRWATTARLQELRPGEHILDERVPQILLTCHEPNFITIDSDFWTPKLCHTGYCIIYIEIDDRRQQEIPRLLRRLFRDGRFKSQKQRLGTVIRVSRVGISFWEVGNATIQHVLLGPSKSPKRKG